jgi:hypothetical protein
MFFTRTDRSRCAVQAGRLAALPGLTGLLLASACGSPAAGPHDVFAILNGFSDSAPMHVDEIIDAGLPGLDNTSAAPVRLRSVQLVDAPPAVRVLNVRAYNIQRAGFGDVQLMAGDLQAECPRALVPEPIDSFASPPRQAPQWFVVIAFRITQPGTFHINRVRINYRSQGHNGWQYQNLNLTLHVRNPPKPGPRPLPATAVCELP